MWMKGGGPPDPAGRSFAIHRDRHRGRVETKTSSASSRAGDRADDVQRHALDHRVVGLGTSFPEALELLTAQGLVRHNQVSTHGSTPQGRFACPELWFPRRLTG
jgi:hypothetical protein